MTEDTAMTKTARYLEAKEQLRMARASLDFALAYPDRTPRGVTIAMLRANVAAADAECERLFSRF